MRVVVRTERFIDMIQTDGMTRQKLKTKGGVLNDVGIIELTSLDDLLAIATKYETIIIKHITGNSVYPDAPDIQYEIFRSFD